MSFGQSIDKLISVWFPGWGMIRAANRMRYQTLANFEGAKKDRRNATWRTARGTQDALAFADLDLLIDRSRDLARNTAVGRAVILSYLRNVIGTGIRPNAKIKNAEGDAIKPFNASVNKEFLRWANNPRMCDAEGRLTFWEMQEQCLQRMLEDGGVLIHRIVQRRRGSRIPLVIKRYEVTQLATELRNNKDTGNEIRRGVEVDKGGMPVAYHLYDIPKNDAVGKSPQRIVRIPADRIDHLYRCERPGQTHGIPLLSVVSQRIWQMAEFDSYEVEAARTTAAIALIINQGTSVNRFAGGGLAATAGESTIDTRGNQEIRLEPNMIFRGQPGDEVKGMVPTRPGSMYAPFTKEQKSATAAGCNLGYEQVARDFSQGTFAAQRQSKLEDQRGWEPLQLSISHHMCIPIHNEFLLLGMLADVFDQQPMLSDDIDLSDVEWQPQGWDWIDPEKEAKAELIKLQMRLQSRTRSAARQGIVWSEEVEQIARDDALLEELGIDSKLPGEKEEVVDKSGEDDDAPPSNNNNGNGNGRSRWMEALS